MDQVAACSLPVRKMFKESSSAYHLQYLGSTWIQLWLIFQHFPSFLTSFVQFLRADSRRKLIWFKSDKTANDSYLFTKFHIQGSHRFLYFLFFLYSTLFQKYLQIFSRENLIFSFFLFFPLFSPSLKFSYSFGKYFLFFWKSEWIGGCLPKHFLLQIFLSGFALRMINAFLWPEVYAGDLGLT